MLHSHGYWHKHRILTMLASMNQYYVYITASNSRRLYIGISNSLNVRLWLHRTGTGSKFAHRYNMTRLVYFEVFEDPKQAIAREKQLKGWKRQRKIDLIEKENPEWKDLSEGWDLPS